MSDLKTLEDLLIFYKSEIFDSDLKAYLSNELVGLYIINIYYPDFHFISGYDDTGNHWTKYLIYILKGNYPSLYKNLSNKFDVSDTRLDNEPLSLIEERILIGICTKILSSEDKKVIGHNLADLTKYLISKRSSQVQDVTKKINKIKNG